MKDVTVPANFMDLVPVSSMGEGSDVRSFSALFGKPIHHLPYHKAKRNKHTKQIEVSNLSHDTRHKSLPYLAQFLVFFLAWRGQISS
jgi:hypothetical protein